LLSFYLLPAPSKNPQQSINTQKKNRRLLVLKKIIFWEFPEGERGKDKKSEDCQI